MGLDDVFRLLDQTAGNEWYNWALTRDGIYFLDSSSRTNAVVKFFDFATGEKRTIFTSDKPPRYGISGVSRRQINSLRSNSIGGIEHHVGEKLSLNRGTKPAALWAGPRSGAGRRIMDEWSAIRKLGAPAHNGCSVSPTGASLALFVRSNPDVRDNFPADVAS